MAYIVRWFGSRLAASLIGLTSSFEIKRVQLWREPRGSEFDNFRVRKQVQVPPD
jgi:hypothetical protein